MKNIAFLFALLVLTCISSVDAAPTTISFQHNVNGYTGARDAEINYTTATTNYGSATDLEMDGDPDKALLLFWDVSSIPGGSVVSAVSITLEIADRSSSTYEIYTLKRAWIENQVTWNNFASGQNWQTPGAQGSADRETTVLGVVSGEVGSRTYTLNAAGVAAVQSWVTSPAANYGFIVLDYVSATNALHVNSREIADAGTRPKLTITYEAGGSQPMLSIGNVSVNEGNSGAVAANFPITLSAAASQTVTVNWATSNGTATAGSDYTAASGQVSFSAGQTSKTVAVQVTGDTNNESNENFYVNLTNPVGAGISDSQGEGTIVNDDGSGSTPSLTIDNVSVYEDAGPLVFLVSLSSVSNQTVSVNYSTVNGTASSSSDYSARSGTLTIPAGYGSGVIVFGNIGDYGDGSTSEGNVANMLKAKNPQFIFTNGDNNYPDGEEATWQPNVVQFYGNYISATDVNANRFYASLGNHDYHVFPSAFLNGLALPPGQGNERYYDLVKGPVHLFCVDSNSEQPDGRSSTSVQGQWLQARLAASNAPWKIVYFHHAPWSSSTNHGSQTVMQWPFDAWGAHAVFAGHDHIYERILKDEDSDGTPLAYLVNGISGNGRYSLGTPISGSVVRYNSDYGAMFMRADNNALIYEFHSLSGGLLDRYVVTRPGASAPPHLVTVPITNDNVTESSETFSVVLSNPSNATIADGTGVATILDNDTGGSQPPAIAINDVSVTEGNSGTVAANFTVSLSASSSQTVTVNYATANGTATAGSDYVAASGQVSFSPGQTSKTVTVQVNGDAVDEPNETFVINLSNAVNATIGDGQGQGTITDDDGSSGAPVTVSFQNGVNGYNGARDTKLLSSSPTNNYGSNTILETDGSPAKTTLLYWDVSSIPAGSQVQSVSVTINVLDRATANSYEMYEAKRAWVENQATWNVYATGQNWGTAGASGSGDRGSTVLGALGGEVGLRTVTLNSTGVAVVQNWVNSPGANFGIVVQDYTLTNGFDFSSREATTAGDRPKLTITYLGAGLAKQAATRDTGPLVPEQLVLRDCYPNPFNAATRIDYKLPADIHVHLAVYDLLGRQIRLLIDEHQAAGSKTITWNARDEAGQPVSSGVYLIQLAAKNIKLNKKITLIK